MGDATLARASEIVWLYDGNASKVGRTGDGRVVMADRRRMTPAGSPAYYGWDIRVVVAGACVAERFIHNGAVKRAVAAVLAEGGARGC